MRNTLLVANAIGTLLCLIVIVRFSSMSTLFALVVYASAFGCIITRQKAPAAAIAATLCVLLGVLGIVGGVFTLFTDKWFAPELHRYGSAVFMLVMFGAVPLLSARLLAKTYSLPGDKSGEKA